jgi:hypothetical protein
LVLSNAWVIVYHLLQLVPFLFYLLPLSGKLVNS